LCAAQRRPTRDTGLGRKRGGQSEGPGRAAAGETCLAEPRTGSSACASPAIPPPGDCLAPGSKSECEAALRHVQEWSRDASTNQNHGRRFCWRQLAEPAKMAVAAWHRRCGSGRRIHAVPGVVCNAVARRAPRDRICAIPSPRAGALASHQRPRAARRRKEVEREEDEAARESRCTTPLPGSRARSALWGALRALRGSGAGAPPPSLPTMLPRIPAPCRPCPRRECCAGGIFAVPLYVRAASAVREAPASRQPRARAR
jgi:hypothetical protein